MDQVVERPATQRPTQRALRATVEVTPEEIAYIQQHGHVSETTRSRLALLERTILRKALEIPSAQPRLGPIEEVEGY